MPRESDKKQSVKDLESLILVDMLYDGSSDGTCKSPDLTQYDKQLRPSLPTEPYSRPQFRFNL